ncbi:MAG: hypothetical protein HW421_1488 [Ignavibacteria bacterium]|nr:hypothetical protein [Ignavibacteria bacterium]
MKKIQITTFLMFCLFVSAALAKPKNEPEKKELITESTYAGMKLRSIGPATASGRVVDIAVNPNDKAQFYVGVACGGVWKTNNSGISFSPVFDSQKSFSIGCISIDPENTNVVWVGTGENNSQRSVSYGDGIYKSLDAGKSWKNMGLAESKHIGRIAINPKNTDIVYAAAMGLLWGPHKERGLFKTTDGGKTWNNVLFVSENTGVVDVVLDPRNPEVIYAASYQRRRHVWTLINGGPESGIFKSYDGGKSWDTLKSGLPSGYVGRIGLALSPANPNFIYAIIEASESNGGFFRSTDRGASWEKRNEYVSGGPQYYHEIICDPKNTEIVYSMDTYSKVSDDGGKTFRNLGNKERHVDDHALWIDPCNTTHLLIGCDGGVYESYDRGATWRFFENLPITQFYRVTVDNSEPFYYVYGGTQDNNTLGGPSRTTNSCGILNQDWYYTVGGDGFETVIDPVDPNIVYSQPQYGWLVRYDKRSGEQTGIQPQPDKGEMLRWNWDSPVIISPFSHTRLYFAANKLFRSDDRGDSWKAISGDLTRQIDRNQLKVMDKLWDPEAVAKNASTSLYGNIISLAESQLKENLIYIGTDDGLIQVTEDAGGSWRKIENFPGVPEMTYNSDVLPSQFAEGTVYATFDNHKMADFKPYVLKSTDKGVTWKSISGNLPENGSVYTIAEDFVNPNLLFVGTEFGLYFTNDGGEKWFRITSGLPTIAIKDIDIQKRESDLVLASFGRGFYILDNYAALREMTKETAEKEAHLFPVKDALMYIENESWGRNSLGESFYRAKNPDFGAVFTYYIKEAYKTKKDLRNEKVKELKKDNKDIPYPGFDELRAEDIEEKPFLLFEITDEAGNLVRRLKTTASAGINRITWDLRYTELSPMNSKTDVNKQSGMPAMPGKYKVTMLKSIDGVISKIAGPVEFTAKPLKNVTLPAKDQSELDLFRKKTLNLMRAVSGTQSFLNEITERIKIIKNTLTAAPTATSEMLEKARKIELELIDIDKAMTGDKSLAKRNENQTPPIAERLDYILYAMWQSSSAPTKTARNNYSIAGSLLEEQLSKLKSIMQNELAPIEKFLDEKKAPWTPGRFPDWKNE